MSAIRKFQFGEYSPLIVGALCGVLAMPVATDVAAKWTKAAEDAFRLLKAPEVLAAKLKIYYEPNGRICYRPIESADDGPPDCALGF